MTPLFGWSLMLRDLALEQLQRQLDTLIERLSDDCAVWLDEGDINEFLTGLVVLAMFRSLRDTLEGP